MSSRNRSASFFSTPRGAAMLLCAATAVLMTMGVTSGRTATDSFEQKNSSEPAQPTAVTTEEAFNALSELVGFAYEIEGAWSFGQAIHARNEFRQGFGGRFIESNIFTIGGEDKDTKTAELYRNIMAPGKQPGTIMIYGFTAEGDHEPIANTLSRSDEGNIILTSRWTRGEGASGTAFKQHMELKDLSYAWRVWIRPGTSTEDNEEAGPWQQIMDGEWIRKQPLDPH